MNKHSSIFIRRCQPQQSVASITGWRIKKLSKLFLECAAAPVFRKRISKSSGSAVVPNYIGDSVCEILIRFIGSLSGSIGVCYAVNKFEASQRIKTVIRWYRVHSLEVYTGHYLFLNLVHANSLVEFQTLYGFALVIVNCALTLSLIWLVVTIVNDNRYIKLVAWGKKWARFC